MREEETGEEGREEETKLKWFRLAKKRCSIIVMGTKD